ncbi:DNA repair exonuclease SbcCD ATPase subunit [Salinibacter ruber]|uniref:hypothetical protein n=1 Tax=Salinibacter ruber TaxID=146919 RepID=UPI002169E98D|nr:hypothetical protein [Salinibacter ruber]MCS3635840.1 DNA repair exonuclease SbcCD ATPase subunit [Salinibacter ruber]MCS3715361.1 DNA repair exonuclease SbcCD ATPase subunit [Salinibacter ruber]
MSGSSSETDASLEDLPELKADLEEARQLISQLEDRKEETNPDRYEHVRQRYEQQIEELEPTVQKLTDQGESRKQDLEDRLATQQEQVEEAEAELREIEQLHEEGAMDEQAYQEDRRRLQQQKNEAEKKASRLERELDEVNFYLTETGNVSYKKKQSINSGPTFREKLTVWLGLQGGMKKVTYFASAAVIAIAMASTVYLIREGKQNEYKMTQKVALIKCTEKASQKFVKALREKQKGNSELSGLLLARMAKKGEAVFVDEGTKITKRGNWKNLIKVEHQNESYCTTKSFIEPID